MTCRACGRDLPTDARFCPGCGVAVVATCPACGTELEADAHFCRRCGQAVRRSPEAPSADDGQARPARETDRERKVATLLFVDIVGFTSLNETHDPEVVSTLVSRAFERLSREVGRYGGTIEKFAGDAMLAVFGVPSAHEDDPERAVRAALTMQKMAAPSETVSEDAPTLRLRLGIATGEVLVDHARATSERDLFVTGDAVNTASRLQAAAGPGDVLVDSATFFATRDAIAYEELEPVTLKGKRSPVAAWRAVSVKAGPEGRRARLGSQAPLVGRDAELSLLKETVRRTVEEARPHLVTIIGSAGVGKSRLTRELERYLDDLPDVFHWRKGRCLAYAGPSFGPIADVIKADARIHDDDAPGIAREKLAARMDGLELDTGDQLLVEALQVVLAVGDSGERARDELFESWRRYLEAVAELAPLVLVVEDIHWADDGVLSFLDFLARWGEGTIVIVCLARHELLEKRPTWGGGLPNATTIVLEPLAEAASSALMEGLLDGGVPPPLGARIIELAEGNPLFVEEMVRMLVDQGVLRLADGRWELAGAIEEVEIPGSVQAVLAARLDTLPTAEKRVAQDAAVVGRIFWDVVVAHLAGSERDPTDELIRRLRSKDIVVRRKPSSLADASEYGFRHALIRDVAYDSLPKRDRSRLHRDVALWAEAELADRIDEFSELIASHLAAALSYEEEFSEDGAELVKLQQLVYRSAMRAARRAAAMTQFDASSRWLRLALDLAWKLEVPAPDIAEITLEFAGAAGQTADPEVGAVALERAIDAVLAVGRSSPETADLLARLRDQLAVARFGQGEVGTARQMLQDALDELEPGPPTAGRALLLNRLGWTYWRAGPIDDAVPILERAIAEAEASGSENTRRWAIHDLGTALAMLDRHDEGIPLLEESLRLALDSGDRVLLLRCYVNIPATRSSRGDALPALLSMIEEGLQLARRAAAGGYVMWLASNAADTLLEMGRLAEAEVRQDEAIRHAQAIADSLLAVKHSSRALMRQLRGDVEGARQDVLTAERIGPATEYQVAWVHPLARARLAWGADPRGAAETLAAWATEQVDGPTPAYELVHTLARMALRLGDQEQLTAAVTRCDLARSSNETALHRAKARWTRAMEEADHRAIEGSATELEALGYRRAAADAWADAALIAARAGLRSQAAERAAALLGAMDMHPYLGPLPEARWLAPNHERAGEAPTA